MKRVIICGSRKWPYERRVKTEICALVSAFGDVTIVHGDHWEGADSFVRKWATNRGAKEERHPADWKRLGRKAGPVRNQEMADAGADLCLAFWDGESAGTLDMMRRASGKGIETKFLLPGQAWQAFEGER